jgi:Bacterial Ig-like domain (group 3)
MVTHILGRASMILIGVVAVSSIAVAQVAEGPDAPDATIKITSVSKMTTAQHQTVTISGSGFGTHKAYTGLSDFISLYDQSKKWEAGYKPDGDTVTLIVTSWTNTKITLGGFAGKWGASNFTLAVGNKVKIRVFNAQGAGGPFGLACTVGCATKTVAVVAAFTSTEISSSPNPSVSGELVTLTAVVTSGDGAPPDGGKVKFWKGEEILGTGTLHDGVASFKTSKLDFGSNLVRAEYSGDADFEATGRDEKSAVETHTVD